ncbi:hypothetical protein FM106_05195 [Brachybacterium faecium]|nr:hypothetical protein FM106_05195 [Brachybacterium faecium]
MIHLCLLRSRTASSPASSPRSVAPRRSDPGAAARRRPRTPIECLLGNALKLSPPVARCQLEPLVVDARTCSVSRGWADPGRALLSGREILGTCPRRRRPPGHESAARRRSASRRSSRRRRIW